MREEWKICAYNMYEIIYINNVTSVSSFPIIVLNKMRFLTPEAHTFYFAFHTTTEQPIIPTITGQESNSLGFEKLTVILLDKNLDAFYEA
jgi:hypothetical protein